VTWFKVDDTLAFHHKVVAAGVSAMGLWVRAGSWSAQTLTDGFVPEHMVPALADGDAGLAARLVEAGLWRRVKGGYAFHEWSERQPSRQSVEKRRSVRAAAGRKGGVRSGQVRGNKESKSEASASSNSEANASAPLEPPSRPDPTHGGSYVEIDPLVDERASENGHHQDTLPDDWGPHDGHRMLCAQRGLDCDHEVVLFRANALDKGRQSHNWHAAFEGWLARSGVQRGTRMHAVNGTSAIKRDPSGRPVEAWG
jgi:hypothetical protein